MMNSSPEVVLVRSCVLFFTCNNCLRWQRDELCVRDTPSSRNTDDTLIGQQQHQTFVNKKELIKRKNVVKALVLKIKKKMKRADTHWMDRWGQTSPSSLGVCVCVYISCPLLQCVSGSLTHSLTILISYKIGKRERESKYRSSILLLLIS